MRPRTGRAIVVRLATLAIVAAMLSQMVLPAIAAAATPRPTIYLNTYYQHYAKSFTISGHIHTRAGRRVSIEIRKPGRTFWDTLGTARVNASKNYSYRYTPKLGGTFYVRTRYGTTSDGKSRTVALKVVHGPGVKTEVLLASTTSTRDSGLFERLGPAFLKSCPEYTLSPVFEGSGASIARGGRGDADVILTHSPGDEVRYMHGEMPTSTVPGVYTTAPYPGLTRQKVMYNDYVLVGDATRTPAGINQTDPALTAFSKVASEEVTFYSRKDGSGTNMKELSLWSQIGTPQLNPDGTPKPWYNASKMGMAQALTAANQSNGYTLSDRATWLNAKSLNMVPNLRIVNQGDANYFNQYAVIRVKGARNFEGAMDFANWITCPEAQELIRTYGQYTYPGQIMFVPNAGPYPW
jgi:tungstate transport system substrate-binding protein